MQTFRFDVCYGNHVLQFKTKAGYVGSDCLGVTPSGVWSKSDPSPNELSCGLGADPDSDFALQAIWLQQAQKWERAMPLQGNFTLPWLYPGLNL